MKVTVDKQTKKFYLAFNTHNSKRNKWVPAVGHEIQVGKYRFSAVPASADHIIISEVTSGVEVMNIKMSQETQISTKKDTLDFLKSIGETSLTEIIEKNHDFDKAVANGKKRSYSMLGEMPPIEVFDMEGAAK
ncbi:MULTISPECIES: hypothetical protein [Bacillus amyloliquefaciens group]|uniref:hypothetical protein n=1 Tax=Bacillus amyloliquefaciens group TaxID=1938374 RepID=UPI000CF0B628|nr:hypothetical protein [Bacillus velezensis]PQB09133.1 hypothetical protein C5O26_23145 [Bacillus velezensis]QWQ47362.1 hypothetical protein KOM03_17900 [Bacillus velezensis]